jgi:hypothetical protein
LGSIKEEKFAEMMRELKNPAPRSQLILKIPVYQALTLKRINRFA